MSLIKQLAQICERKTKNNLLHQAALVACETGDYFYFVRLLDLNFPLYTMNAEKQFPSYLIVQIQVDSSFLISYYALCEKGFDLTHKSHDELDDSVSTCFLEKFLKEGVISAKKVEGIQQKKPKMLQAMAKE